MPRPLRHACLSLLIAAASGTALVAASAQTMPAKDPPQWHTEDTTPQMRYQTSKKEAGAALEEARKECRTLRGSEAAACNREARNNYEKDMAEARKQLGR